MSKKTHFFAFFLLLGIDKRLFLWYNICKLKANSIKFVYFKLRLDRRACYRFDSKKAKNQKEKKMKKHEFTLIELLVGSAN